MKDRIKYVIEILSLSRKEFAQKIGASPGNIGDWISGRSEPSARYIRRIYEVFNVDPTWLLTGEGSPFRARGEIDAKLSEIDRKLVEIQRLKNRFQQLLKEKALLDQKIMELGKELQKLEREYHELCR